MSDVVSAPARPLDRAHLTRFAWLSVATAVVTISLKSVAYLMTGSVGLLSDAIESVVNLVAAIVALVALGVAARPADEGHHFGHAKAEYFSAAVEGGMIFVAAVAIVWKAVPRLLDPQGLENVGPGLAISLLASALNGGVALVLLRAGRRHRSLTLVADGKHLLTDVWTSAGVLVGILLVSLTGIHRLDPIIAILVGLNIIWTGYRLLSESVSGLMDSAWPEEERTRLDQVLSGFANDEVQFHALRTRLAGHARFAEVHVLVPGGWSVQQAHDRVEEIEAAVAAQFDDAQLVCHVEPSDDPVSYGPYLGDQERRVPDERGPSPAAE